MRKTLAYFILAAAPLLAAEGGALTPTERAFLIEQMEASKKLFLASIDGVTAAQWKFKPAPTVWSVAECAEHITLSEGFLFGVSQQMLNSPAVPRPESSNAEQDKKLVAAVGDRSHKATAPEPIVPSGQFATPADAVREFTARRDRNIAYARTTTDELRVHVSAGPLGPMDAYQFLLLMASHTARHTAQIREVQSNEAYPKTSAKLQFLLTYTLARGTADQLTPAQLKILGEHGAYLQKQASRGLLAWGGRVADPKSPRGLALLEVSSEDQVREHMRNDPAVKADILHCASEPFSEFIRVPKG